ncbi:MAG: ComF family protein [Phycisphaerae bacterium]|nr:ComF family protein [Phycisphaerae bacterium]
MARRLGVILGNQVLSALRPDQLPEAVVPIPMPQVRRLVRGIDHADEIAHGVSQVLKVPLWRPLWHVPGRTQVSRSQSERRRATHRLEAKRRLLHFLTDGRSVPREHQSRYRRVLLVDDVRTTGATLEQAARVLRSLGVSECWSAVVAVAPSPRRYGSCEREQD